MPKPSFSRANNSNNNTKSNKSSNKSNVSTSNKVFGIIAFVIVTYYFFFEFGNNKTSTKQPAQSKDQSTPAVVKPQANSNTQTESSLSAFKISYHA